ncbi:MAG: hypothetical protein II295_09710 [Akkermansia sp.]|nr:hypothetical protein [Akkermansia sp.]
MKVSEPLARRIPILRKECKMASANLKQTHQAAALIWRSAGLKSRKVGTGVKKQRKGVSTFALLIFF